MKIKNFNDVRSLLLDNTTVKQTIFKNTFWISLSEGVGKLLRAFLVIYITRILGATKYGEFTFALAFVSLFVVFFDLGISTITTKELSQDKSLEKEFSSILSLRIILGLGSIVLIFISSFFITSDIGIREIIWILAVFTFFSQFPEIIYAFFRYRQRMEYESWLNIIQALLVVGFGFFVIFNFPSVKNVSYGYLFSGLISLIFLLLFCHFKVFHLKLSFDKNIWRKFLMISWPLALASLFGTVYGNFDSVLMGKWGLITETGWYNAAFKIIDLIVVPANIIAVVFYPAISKFAKNSRETVQKIWNYQVGMATFLGVPIVVGGMVFASKIIDFVYGLSFPSSILIFQILLATAGIVFISTPLSQNLIAFNQQKKFFLVTLAGGITNIVLNLILIPRFSLRGAAVANVATYLLILSLYLIFTYKFTSIKPLTYRVFVNFIKIAFSSFAMYLVVSRPQIYNLHILLSIPIGAAVYVLTFLTLFKLTKN